MTGLAQATNIYYDLEFHERGHKHPIDLISIGMCTDDGRELYRISRSFDRRAVAKNAWLMANVVPSLPFQPVHGKDGQPATLRLDRSHPDYQLVRGRAAIAQDVASFVLSVPRPRLCAWFGAYDHVVTCQLFGTMARLPGGFPMWTYDLKQEADRLGNPRVPKQAAGEHNALADARQNRIIAQFLREYAMGYSP